MAKVELQVFKGSKTVDGKKIDYTVNLVDHEDVLLLELIKTNPDGTRCVSVVNLSEWKRS